MDKEHKAIAHTQACYEDAKRRGKTAIDAFEKGLCTPEEMAASDLRVELMNEFIKARNERGMSQRELGELCGVKQPVIARMEKGVSIPQVNTLLKMLVPLGKKLAIVPI